MTMKKHGWLFGLIAALSASALIGCGGSSTNTTLQPDPLVRFIAGVADSANVDFLANDEPAASNLAYRDTVVDFKSLPFLEDADGGYDISVSTVDGEELERINTVFPRDTSTFIISYGKYNYGDEIDKRPQLALLTIDRTAPVGNKAKLLIFNALVRDEGIENGPFDFQTVDPSNPLSQSTPLFQKQNIGYGQFGGDANTLTIDSGTQTFQAREPAGDGSNSVTVLAQKTFTFLPGRIYIALVSGITDSTVAGQGGEIAFYEVAPKL